MGVRHTHLQQEERKNHKECGVHEKEKRVGAKLLDQPYLLGTGYDCTTDKREQISPMGYNLLRKDVITLKDAVKYLERSVKKQHQADTHHDLIYLLTRAHEAYKNSKK